MTSSDDENEHQQEEPQDLSIRRRTSVYQQPQQPEQQYALAASEQYRTASRYNEDDNYGPSNIDVSGSEVEEMTTQASGHRNGGESSSEHIPAQDSSPEYYETANHPIDAGSSASDEDNPALVPLTVDSEPEDTPSVGAAAAAENARWWKYKVIPKGPQGQVFDLRVTSPEDPHKPMIFADPAFHHEGQLALRHFGKARTGEGNDISPNPRKLVSLGRQIEGVNGMMTALGSSHQKEKSKLISRQCRLKKTANHEANKIIFHGLEKEREELSKIVTQVKSAVVTSESQPADLNLSELCTRLSNDLHVTKVAGRTGKYVDDVLAGHGY